MSKIIRSSERREITVHSLFFQKIGASAGNGRIFDCNAKGVVVPDSIEWAAETIASGDFEVGVIQSEQRIKKIPALMECNCGCRFNMPVTGHDTSCPTCGIEFNGFGQQLAPRQFWSDIDRDY